MLYQIFEVNICRLFLVYFLFVLKDILTVFNYISSRNLKTSSSSVSLRCTLEPKLQSFNVKIYSKHENKFI